MDSAYICDAIRTPFGRYGGALAVIRTDDLAAIPIKALVERNPKVDWNALDDVVYGCANQAGEDNRNVGRMALLLAGLPKEVPGSTVNRLCGSSMDAIGTVSRAIKSGEGDLAIAGGVESMSRAPFVMGKADSAFSRTAKLEDRMGPAQVCFQIGDTHRGTALRAGGQAFALQGQDADQAAVVLGDIDDVVSIHVEKGRANQRRGPDLQQFAILVKDLHAVVLAVRHQHAPVLINPDAVR